MDRGFELRRYFSGGFPLAAAAAASEVFGIENRNRRRVEDGHGARTENRNLSKVNDEEEERERERRVTPRRVSQPVEISIGLLGRPSVARFVAHSFQFAVTLERPFPDAKGVRSPSPALNSLANFLAINWRGGSCRLD